MTLNELALRQGTDKSSAHHNYCHTYEIYFNALRGKPIYLLELGVGGYKYPNRGGEGLRMWCEYFSNGRIVSVDLYDKSQITVPKNGKVYQGSQTDKELMMYLCITNKPDIIIDDASHINPLTIESFEILFPYLKSGGYYVIEDCHTSYWKDIASDGTDFGGGEHEGTVMSYFKRLCDNINLKDNSIRSIHFYKQLIFILKK